MNYRYAILVVVILFVACKDDSAKPETAVLPDDVLVYADRGAKQCESDGVSIDASAQKLINAGIDVLRSTCGFKTGVEFPAVCGGETADILVHEIRVANIPDAEPLGFQEISTLVDAASGTSYELIDCDNR